MAIDKFDKSKCGLEAGQFSGVKLDNDNNISLESGFSSGTYVTPIYHSDGSATKVSWSSNETTGEINLISGLNPKVIEMRASNIAPETEDVVITGDTFVPDFSYGFSQIDENWTVSITGIKQSDNVYTGSTLRMSFGAPIIRQYSENVSFSSSPGIIQIDKGLAYSKVNYDNIYTGANLRMSFGQPITKAYAENVYNTKGIFQISYTGSVIIG